jgi:hypothetical protein
VKKQKIKLASTSSPKSKKFVERSGNSSDRTNCTVAEVARAALARPIPNHPDDKSFAEGIVERLAWMALAGDREAFEYLVNRAEGTPRRTLDAGDTGPDKIQELIDGMHRKYESLQAHDQDAIEGSGEET